MKLGVWYYSKKVYAFPFFYHSKNGVGAFRFAEGNLNSLEFAPLLKSVIDEEFKEIKINKEIEEALKDIIRLVFDTREEWRFDLGYMRQLKRKE